MSAGDAARAISVALVILTMTSGAAGEPTPADRALAETLFREARELMKHQQWDEACPKLEESQRLDPAGGTLLNLALCHEALGKVASAWAEFRDALALARRDDAKERQRIASEHLTAIEPKVPRLVIDVPDAARAPSLEVSLDGEVIRSVAWQTAVPVDPGMHRVAARAPGKQAWDMKVKLETASGETHVTVPVLQAEPRPAGAASAGAAAPLTDHRPAAAPDAAKAAAESDARGTLRTASFIAFGAGAIGIGIGTVFGIRAIQKRHESDTQCPNDNCTADGLALNEQAQQAAVASNAAFAIGLTSAVVGAILFAFSIKKPKTTAAAALNLPGGFAVPSRIEAVRHAW